MGENEQGGMLRVVVVLGLIAIIASVIIGGVASADGHLRQTLRNSTMMLTRAQATITEADVPASAWQKYDGSKTYTIKSGQHVAIRSDYSIADSDLGDRSFVELGPSAMTVLKSGERGTSTIGNGDHSTVVTAREVGLHQNATIAGHNVSISNVFDMTTSEAGVDSSIKTYADYMTWGIQTGGPKDENGLILPAPDNRADLSFADWVKWIKGDGAELVQDPDWLADHHFYAVDPVVYSNGTYAAGMLMLGEELDISTAWLPVGTQVGDKVHYFGSSTIGSADYTSSFYDNMSSINQMVVDLTGDSSSVKQLDVGSASDLDDVDATFTIQPGGGLTSLLLSARNVEIAIW